MGMNIPELLERVCFVKRRAMSHAAGAVASKSEAESYLGDTKAEGRECNHLYLPLSCV